MLNIIYTASYLNAFALKGYSTIFTYLSQFTSYRECLLFVKNVV